MWLGTFEHSFLLRAMEHLAKLGCAPIVATFDGAWVRVENAEDARASLQMAFGEDEVDLKIPPRPALPAERDAASGGPPTGGEWAPSNGGG
jgi:hypothetical protein